MKPAMTFGHKRIFPKLLVVFSAVLLVGGLMFVMGRRSLPKAMAADTGVASLVSATDTQVGTGQIGEDATHVLTNNTVKWTANYNFTTSGTVTVTATINQLSTWDASTVNAINGCGTGSSIDTAGNVATCVMSGNAGEVKPWGLSATVLGANGATVQPTFTDSAGVSPVVPTAVTLVASRAQYDVATYNTYPTRMPATGGDTGLNIGVVFVVKSPLVDGGVLGLEPLTSPMSFTVNTASIPDPSAWTIKGCSAGVSTGNSAIPNYIGSGVSNYYRPGTTSCVKAVDGQSVTITFSDSYTGGTKYPSKSSTGYLLTEAFYADVRLDINVPLASLSTTPANVVLTATPLVATTLSGGPVSSSVIGSQSYALSSKPSFGGDLHVLQATENLSPNVNLPGWINGYANGQPILPSTDIRLNVSLSVTGPTGFVVENPWGCLVMRPNSLELLKEGFFRQAVLQALPSVIEYGVFSNNPPVSTVCGVAGDGAPGWYATLAEAQNAGVVNAVRYKLTGVLDGQQFTSGNSPWFSVDVKSPPNGVVGTALTDGTPIQALWAAGADNIDRVSSSYPARMIATSVVSSNKISVTKSSLLAGETQTVSILPTLTSTVNTTTTVIETVTLSADLAYVSGSARFGGVGVTEPTTTINSDGTTTLVFNLGVLAAGQTNALTFDVNVAPTAVMPTTATITALVDTSSSAALAQTTMRTAAVSFNVAAPPATFAVVQSQSLATIQPGMEQVYTFSHVNTTNSVVTGLTAIDVLPYSGDVNGSTGITGYTVSSLSATGAVTNFYYTTSLAVRNDPTGAVTWVAACVACELPAGVTALKWTTAQMASNTSLQVSFKLTKMTADNGATINNALTVLDSSFTSTITNSALMSAVFKKSSVSGAVYKDVNGSGVFDGGDIGLSGLTVSLVKGDATVATTVTDLNGAYRFSDLSSGTYSVTVATPANMVTNGNTAEDINLLTGVGLSNQNIGFEDLIIALYVSPNPLSLKAASTSGTVSGSIDLTTATNNPLGYRLGLSTADNRLVCLSPSAFINSVTGTGISLADNTWGYKISDETPTSWNEIPMTITNVKSTSAAAKLGDVTKLYFGVKVNLAVPDCDYSGMVMVTAVGNI